MQQIEVQIIRKEVEEQLKSLARQVGLKLGEQEALLEKVLEAMGGISNSLQKLDTRITALESPKTE